MERIVSSSATKTVAVVSATVASAGILSLLYKKLTKSRCCIEEATPKKWIRVGTISKLIVYPVKSCAGVEFSELEATPMGLKGADSDALRDRIFLIVDYKYGCQTQRVLPKMALIQVEVKGHEVKLSGPGIASITIPIPKNIRPNKRSCRIWDDHVREVLDCGDEIGNWLDKYFEGKGYRLVYHALDHTQRLPAGTEKKFPTFYPQHKGSFQDNTSYMIMTEKSIAHVNEKLVGEVTYKNFRPSILLNNVAEPFAEELWSYVRIGSEGGPILQTSQPCMRCRLTTINPATAEFNSDGQPLKTLLGMEKRSVGNDVADELIKDSGVLGIQLGLYQGGRSVKVGDPVYAALL